MKGQVFLVLCSLEYSSPGLNDEASYPHTGLIAILSPWVSNSLHYLYRVKIKVNSSNHVGFRGGKGTEDLLLLMENSFVKR